MESMIGAKQRVLCVAFEAGQVMHPKILQTLWNVFRNVLADRQGVFENLPTEGLSQNEENNVFQD